MGVSYLTIIRHLQGSLEIKNFHLRWAPHELTPDLHGRRREICERLLPISEAREPDSFRILVAGDENWFTVEHQHSAKWDVARDELPTRASEMTGTKRSC
jgi:hypothetical protein